MQKSLQDTYGPSGSCFGCGPKNEKGLRIKSYYHDGEYVVKFTPEPHHQAFSGVVNGGIIGSVFDCHMNWTAAHTLFLRDGGQFPSTVTAEFGVRLKRPTPYGTELVVTARSVEVDGNKVVVEGEMTADGKVTAKGRGIFVAVQEGHPGYHRWD